MRLGPFVYVSLFLMIEFLCALYVFAVNVRRFSKSGDLHICKELWDSNLNKTIFLNATCCNNLAL